MAIGKVMASNIPAISWKRHVYFENIKGIKKSQRIPITEDKERINPVIKLEFT